MALDDRTAIALEDIWLGFRRIHVPLALGWEDLRGRYRRTVLGPLWIALGTGLTILGLGVVWSTIFDMKLGDLFPYLTAGDIAWQLISSAITEGAVAFTGQAHIIRSVNLPLSFHILRQSTRNMVNFSHNLLVFAVVAVVFGVKAEWRLLLELPALALVFVNLFWVGMLLGLLGARFRDLPSLLPSIMTVIFLITPVMWKPEMMAQTPLIIELNPFAYFIEILRAPLLGHSPSPTAWKVAGASTVLGLGFTFVVFRSWRRHLPFWL
jgi:lipopolysaccharide transport system permease protein